MRRISLSERNGALGHGQVASESIRLVHLSQWARCFEHIRVLAKLGHALLDMIRYLELNADSLPDYGKRSRSRFRISAGSPNRLLTRLRPSE